MRIARVIFAYVAAAAVGVVVLLLSIWAAEGFGDLGGSLLFVILGIPFAAAFAAPLALPAIILSEWRGISSWIFFSLTGVLTGLLINFLIASYPLRSDFLFELAAFLFANVAAAMTYWWLAGRFAGKPLPNARSFGELP